MKNIRLTESQINKLKKNLLLERECPKGLVFDETLDSCIEEEEELPNGRDHIKRVEWLSQVHQLREGRH